MRGNPTVEPILFRTPTQVNAKSLLREVQAAEEGVEAGRGGRGAITYMGLLAANWITIGTPVQDPRNQGVCL